MSFKRKKLAIVVLSYNTEKLLKDCLRSLVKQRGKSTNPEIIVVDNGSKDKTLSMIKKEGFKVTVIAQSENLGFCEGNNIGVKHALGQGFDYVMLLNSDTLVKDRFWEPLVSFLEKNEKAGVVTPKIYFAPGYEYHQKRYKKKDQGNVIWSVGGEIDWNNVIGASRGVDEVDRGQFEKVIEVDSVSGCCLLARAKTWKEVGFLDEKYFMYYEDTDFSQKAKNLGWGVFYVPQGRVWHLNAKSSAVGGSLQDYFISRNRLLFGLRFAPLRAKISLVKESLKLLIKGRKWQKLGVRDYYLGKFRRGSWQ